MDRIPFGLSLLFALASQMPAGVAHAAGPEADRKPDLDADRRADEKKPEVERKPDVPRRTEQTVGLREALAMAERDPPSVLLALATLQTSRAQEGAAFATYLPSFQAEGNAGFGYNYQKQVVALASQASQVVQIDAQSFTALGSAGLDWALIDLARGNRLDSARRTVRADRFAYASAKRQAMVNVAELFVRAQSAIALTEDARLTLKRRTDQHDAASDLTRAGLRPPVDAERTRIELISAQRNVEMRLIDERAAAAALATALGRDPLVPLHPALGDARVLEINVTPEAASNLAKQNRPELKQYQATVEARRADYDAAVAARFPTLGLQGNANVTYTDILGGAGLSQTSYSALGVGYLRWRGLDPATWAQGSVARAAVVEAERALDIAAVNVTGEAVAAAYVLNRASVELQRAIGVLDAATSTREAQNGRYKTGVASLLEVLDAEAVEQQARLDRIQAVRDFEIAGARLMAACGTLEKLAQ